MAYNRTHNKSTVWESSLNPNKTKGFFYLMHHIFSKNTIVIKTYFKIMLIIRIFYCKNIIIKMNNWNF